MNILEIKNNLISLKYNLQIGSFSIFQNQEIIIEDAFTEVILKEEKYSSISASATKIEGEVKNNILEVKNIYPKVENFLRFIVEEENFIQIESFVKNTHNEEITISSISPFCVSNKIHLFKDGILKCYFYKQGYQSWSPTLSLKTTSCDLIPKGIFPTLPLLKKIHLSIPYHKTIKKKGYLSSDSITVISNKNNFLLVGFLSAENFLSQVKLQVGSFEENKYKLCANCETEEYLLSPEEEITSGPLVINFLDDKFSSLQKYAQKVGKNMSALSKGVSPVGWCSWYYYFNKITECEILKNLEILKNIKEELPLSFVQIDDGYQKEIGDWLKTNNKFQSGMKYIADKIKESGFLPGLWVAPFIVRPSSSVFKEHYEWVLKDEKDRPVLVGINPLWGGKYFALDLTHPGVEEYLRNTFKTITQDFGYEFLKLDFIFAGALPGKHYHKNTTRVQAYRKGLQIIREAVGDEIFILGCGAPIFPSIGLVNGMRISGDVDPSWVHWSGKIVGGDDFTISCRNAIRNTITRYFTHNIFWINDPDCIMVRSDKTKLNQEEIKTLVSVAGLSGGIFLSSDNFVTLERERLKYLQYCLPPACGKITPLDIFSNDFPSYLLYEFEKNKINWNILGMINWEKRAKNMEISTEQLKINKDKRYYLYNFWRKELIKEVKDKIIIKVPPHGCELLRLIPVEESIPSVIPTFSLSCGEEMEEYYFSSTLNQLYFKIKIPYIGEGDIIVIVPENLIFENFNADARCDLRTEDNVITLFAKINKKATFTLNFRKK